MNLEERKARLVSLILSIDEDELIHILEEDVVAYKAGQPQLDAYGLSPQDAAELRELAKNDDPENYISLEEFRKEIASWRTR